MLQPWNSQKKKARRSSVISGDTLQPYFCTQCGIVWLAFELYKGFPSNIRALDYGLEGKHSNTTGLASYIAYCQLCSTKI